MPSTPAECRAHDARREPGGFLESVFPGLGEFFRDPFAIDLKVSLLEMQGRQAAAAVAIPSIPPAMQAPPVKSDTAIPVMDNAGVQSAKDDAVAQRVSNIRKLVGPLGLLIAIAIILFILIIFLPTLFSVQKKTKNLVLQKRIAALAQSIISLFPKDPGFFNIFLQMLDATDQQIEGVTKSGGTIRDVLHPRLLELIERSRGEKFTDEEDRELEQLLNAAEEQVAELAKNVPSK